MTKAAQRKIKRGLEALQEVFDQVGLEDEEVQIVRAVKKLDQLDDVPDVHEIEALQFMFNPPRPRSLEECDRLS